MFEVRIVTYQKDKAGDGQRGFYAPLARPISFDTSEEAISWVNKESHRTGKCYGVFGDGFKWASTRIYSHLDKGEIREDA